jgi:chorismate synthase
MIRYLTAGESHGQALIGIVEGIPAGVSISAVEINRQLWRRQQGYGRGGRMRIESDTVEILSGVRFGKSLGSPIALKITNRDWQNWTEKMSVDGTGKNIDKITLPRPGHADFVGSVKYAFDDIRNVIDRASARETAMRVACCTVSRIFLEEIGISIGSHVLSIGPAGIIRRTNIDGYIKKFSSEISMISELADKSEVRILDKKTEADAIGAIKSCKKKGDTLGGIFEVLVSGVPVGLGSYVHYDRKLDGQIAQAMMSIHAVKGVEIGDGFENAKKYGSDVHDEMLTQKGKVVRPTNRAGGLEGGVSNGELLVIRGAMKPISTLANPLRTVDIRSHKTTLSRYERSDVCAVPACSVIGEAVVAPVIANAFLEKYGGDSVKEIKKRYRTIR